MKAADITSLVLASIGALNWGLVGAFNFNLVDTLLGEDSALSNIVYVLVGLAGLWCLISILPKLALVRTHMDHTDD